MMIRQAYAGPPINPLGRRFWMLDEAGEHVAAFAELAGMLMGMHALVRVLANGEPFRVQHDANQQHPIEQAPLDAPVTEGPSAALYFLSEQTQFMAEQAMERPGAG